MILAILRILGAHPGSVERENRRSLKGTLAVVSAERKIDMFRLLYLACIVALASLFSLELNPLIAAEDTLGLEALLELDPFDWGSIHPQKVFSECTLALANKPKLKEDQICRLYLLRGFSLQFLGKGKAAISDLTELLKLRPKDCQALRLRGELYAALKQHDKARVDFEALIELRPKSGIGYALLARCLEESGDKESIKRLAEKAIEVDSAEPQGYFVRAAVYMAQHEYQLGLKDLTQCISLLYGDGTMEAARPYSIRAAVLLDIFDNPKRARSDLMMAREINPSDNIVKSLYCTYYFKTGKYNLAFHLSQQLSTDRTDVLCRKVDCLVEHNERKKALQIAESIVQQAPRWWGSYRCRGEVFFSQGSYKEALQDYDKSLDFHRDPLGSLAAKAYLLATCPDKQFRDGPAARALATKCCERTDYQVPRQLMLLATTCAECGDYKAAVRWAKKSLEKADPMFPFMEDYRKRLALFEKGKPYRYSPDSRVFDYLF